MKLHAEQRRIHLKQQRGWLAAGEGFQRALLTLSDGAFRLFAWLSLRARPTDGCVEVTHKELALALGRSKRALGIWAAELKTKGICYVHAGTNQHQPTRFEIRDEYWPYHKVQPLAGSTPANGGRSDKEIASDVSPSQSDPEDYVRVAGEWFAGMKCGKGSFNRSDARFAAQLERRGVLLRTLENALLLGQARKYLSWLNGGEVSTIGSLRYFEPLIQEVEATQAEFTDDYRRYLRSSINKLAAQWSRTRASEHSASAVSEETTAGSALAGGAKR